jgi:hypothetical protein
MINESGDASSLHTRLNDYNRERLRPALESADIDREADLRLSGQEAAFVEEERRTVRDTVSLVPSDPSLFVTWFESLEATGEGQRDPLFDWLASTATLNQMRWFLHQEVAGEAGFDDLVAMTQVKMPDRVKLELGRNYWDELGCGHAGGMHGPMLTRLVDSLDSLDASGEALGPVVWESLALGNLMIALAANRRYAYQSIGALGVIELTAPGRATKVNAGLQRLGIAGEARRYYALHATLDVKHSAAWNREILHTLVADDGRAARPIAEGALMRLRAGRRCFERYRSALAWDGRH